MDRFKDLFPSLKKAEKLSPELEDIRRKYGIESGQPILNTKNLQAALQRALKTKKFQKDLKEQLNQRERLERIDEYVGVALKAAGALLGRQSVAAAGQGIVRGTQAATSFAAKAGYGSGTAIGGKKGAKKFLKQMPLIGRNKRARQAVGSASRAFLNSPLPSKAQQLGSYMANNPIRAGLKLAAAKSAIDAFRNRGRNAGMQGGMQSGVGYTNPARDLRGY